MLFIFKYLLAFQTQSDLGEGSQVSDAQLRSLSFGNVWEGFMAKWRYSSAVFEKDGRVIHVEFTFPTRSVWIWTLLRMSASIRVTCAVFLALYQDLA